MRYASKRNDKAKQVSFPTEVIIPLLTPVRIYSAKELAAMPLTKMNAAIEAQEKFYLLEQTTQMGGVARTIRRLMEDGHKLIQVNEKNRTRYKIQNEFIPPRIVRQLEKRGLVKLGE